MREFWKDRGTPNRMIAATVATLAITVGTSALAQSGTKTPAELAIEAAVPVPESANLPPPSPADFAAQAKALAGSKPADTASAPAAAPAPTASAETKKDTPQQDTAKQEPASAGDTKIDSASKTPAVAPAKPGTETARDTAKETTKDDAAKDTAAKAEAAKAEAAKADAAKADAAKAETAKAEAAKASSVAVADQPVADKLRDLIAAKSAKYLDRKNERAAVEKFYGDRSFAPLWTAGGVPTPAALGVIERLKAADKDGLETADYPVPDFSAAKTPDDLADAELKLTASMFDYARQAQNGRVHWSRVSADIAYPEHPVDPTEVLINVTTAKSASLALQSYNPPQQGYIALRTKLAELRGETDKPLQKIEEGPALKYVAESGGKKSKKPAVVPEDARVPQLRTRLGLTDNATDTHYDETVAAAVRKFQASAGLDESGVLNNQTVRALNSPKRDRQIETVLLNMERWRWLPRNLGEPKLNNAYVILNIPDYTLKVMQGGAQVWTTRVVTGKPGIHATPLLTETMKFITINPTWNVPPSIIQNEYLPALAQDPTVLQRMGLKLETAADGSVHISQPPGEANALGRIRFNFPNKFLVYQHDTPDKYLFAKDERAYSHGCMRVQYPDQYAEVLLGIALPQGGYSAAKIRSMYGTSEQDIRFPTPIPVNITYQTAFVDDHGKLEIRKDVYGRDAQLAALLKGGNRAMAELPVERAQPSYSTRPKMPVTQTADNGPGFFSFLFGGPRPPTPPAPVQRPRRSTPR